MADSLSSQGMQITINTIEIDGVTTVTPPGISKDENDVTVHSSKGYKEVAEGLADSGTITLNGNVWPDDAGQIELRRCSKPNTGLHNFVIQTPNLPGIVRLSWAFRGFVKEYTNEGGEVGGIVKFSATIRISGEVTETVIPPV